MDKFRTFIREHKWASVLTVLGAVIVTLMLTIGFFRTLLIAIVVGICFFCGFVLDTEGPAGFRKIFRQIFRKD